MSDPLLDTPAAEMKPEDIEKLRARLHGAEMRVQYLQGVIHTEQVVNGRFEKEIKRLQERVFGGGLVRGPRDMYEFRIDVQAFYLFNTSDRERMIRCTVVDAVETILHKASGCQYARELRREVTT